ncbi:hypothetical protein DFH08DRAFT_974506 [Mycena albidolilacea]|uniref:Uncharacterized protein n=1 Tax=Mycena albidolilacea TaxID=1033008 RepID=A0AAD6Z7H4_9AGAR|nr:hypothetical protein DFH08DRAFT_974506 [Mycena albidolilacea]
MAMATRRSKCQQKRSPDPDAPPPSLLRRVKGAKKGAAGPSVPKDRSACSKNNASLSIVPAPAPAAKRKQAEAGADSEDDHVNKKARQTADSDDKRPAPAPLRDTMRFAEVGGNSQDTYVDKDSRHDTGDIQDEEGDVQDEEGDVQDADEANAGTVHQSEGSGGTVSVKEQKLQQLAKNPLLLSLQPPPQQQQVPVNATSKYQYRVSNGLVFSLQQQQGTSSFEPNTDAHRDEDDPEVAYRTGTPVPDNFTNAAHDSQDDDVVMPLDADDDDSDSDQSNFSTTHAATEEALRLKNRTITDNGWVATMDTREEEDLDLEEEYLQDVAKPKGKGKAAAVESSDGEEDPFPVASDDDEDEDETPNGHITPWTVGPGALSSAHLKEARAAGAAYHATLEDIARRTGKKMSTSSRPLATTQKASGTPIPGTLTPEESQAYEKAREESYNTLFASLSDDGRRDPEARRLCVTPLMKWHHEKTITPHPSAVSNSLDIEVFGLVLDCFGDNAIIWGGGALFQEVFKHHPLPIRKFLIDMKGLFQTTSLYLRNQAETAAAPSMMQPVPITFTRLPTEASERNALRQQLTALFVNQICLVMIERGELELEKIKATFQKMSWKWANNACKHQLRIENWPAALKETYPGPGFSLGVITEKDNKKEEKRARMDAVKAMFNAMKAAYQSPDADDGLESTKIVSWTDEEIELEDPSNVPIVSCDDGTVLLWASASKSLLAKIKNSKKSSKKKTRATANASGDDDMDNEDEMPPPPPKSGKGKGKSKAPTAAGTPAPAAATSDVAPVAGRKQIKFRYRNGEVMSDVFSATELVRYMGTPTNVQQNILMYSDATGKWIPLPPGFEPQISLDLEAICEVYRLNIGLL